MCRRLAKTLSTHILNIWWGDVADMQYYIKIFSEDVSNDADTGNETTVGSNVDVLGSDIKSFIGYYKETGNTCITKMPKGMKYFNDVRSAMNVIEGLDYGFVRNEDKHYVRCRAFIYGDSKRQPVYNNPYERQFNRVQPMDSARSKSKGGYSLQEDGEVMESAIDTFIRQNRGKIR